jgi:hypothetical protein
LNPQVDSNQKAQIEASSRVFRDGVETFTGTPQPMNTDVQTDMKKMVGGGALKLGGKMQPGDYVLQGSSDRQDCQGDGDAVVRF